MVSRGGRSEGQQVSMFHGDTLPVCCTFKGWRVFCHRPQLHNTCEKCPCTTRQQLVTLLLLVETSTASRATAGL